VSRTPTHLVTGATAAGKSTLIARLLAHRSPEEHWGVLINDFGHVRLRESLDAVQGRLTIREVAGCICCSAQLALRTALVDMLRRSAPDRLFIEVSAAAEPKALLDLLHAKGIAEAVELRSTVCVVDLKQLSTPAYIQNNTYIQQIGCADALYISNARASEAAELRAGQAALEQLKSATSAVFLQSDPFDITQLELARS
jgi:G3E family GTPase